MCWNISAHLNLLAGKNEQCGLLMQVCVILINLCCHFGYFDQIVGKIAKLNEGPYFCQLTFPKSALLHMKQLFLFKADQSIQIRFFPT